MARRQQPKRLLPLRHLVLAGALPLLIATACEKAPPPEAPIPPEPRKPTALLEPSGFEDLPGWEADSVAEALPALRRSCRRILPRADDKTIGPNALGGRVADWRPICEDLERLAVTDDISARLFFETWFTPFLVSDDGDSEGLFTGYYEAELRGDTKPNGRYRFPLYTRPADLVSVDLGDFRADLEGERIVGRVDKSRLVPYFSRAEIERGALSGQKLELIWADDPVDVFFLHVQGSGQVRLPDGRVKRVGFAASNGLPFYAIGRAMIQEKVLDGGDVSMQSIRDWLRRNPAKAESLMHRNGRFIFFREIEGEGPIGAQGVPLTAGRSLAVDPSHLPLGAPIFLDTTWPASDRPLQRLLVAQDTGSAIKGVVRGDFFWGSGEPALAEAGRMKQTGRYFILLPKTVAARRATAS